jgi:hypothetical protein
MVPGRHPTRYSVQGHSRLSAFMKLGVCWLTPPCGLSTALQLSAMLARRERIPQTCLKVLSRPTDRLRGLECLEVREESCLGMPRSCSMRHRVET